MYLNYSLSTASEAFTPPPTTQPKRASSAPYFVTVRDGTRARAWGGAIISRRYILTSAHHLVGKNESDIFVQAGTSSLNFHHGTIHQVSRIIVHKLYNKHAGHLHNLALLHLKHPLRFDDNHQKIELLNDIEKYGTNGTVFLHDGTNRRRNFSMPILRNEECDKVLKESLKRNQMCTGFVHEQGFCAGGQAGPIVVNEKLAGIFSQDLVCDMFTQLSVFTEVALHRDWIGKNSDIDTADC